MKAVEELHRNNLPRERASFSILVREHHRGLLAYARALTGEDHTSRDIVQDALVVAWKNLESYDVSRDFGSWTRGIVRNKWHESLRKNAKLVSVEESSLEYLENDMEDWDGVVDAGGLFERLEQCLKKLPSDLNAAVKAFYYEDCSGAEAAEQLNVQSATLRKRLERARSGLRACLAS